MKKPRSELREQSAGHVLELVNRLERYALTVSPEAIRQYSCHDGSPNGGCNKFLACDIHPQHLKDRAISEMEPAERARLKELGCLRPLVFEHEEAFRHALARGDLSVSDFFGAAQGAGSSDVAKLLASHRCSYHGCVVPEMARLLPANGSNDPYRVTCPFSKRTNQRTQRPQRNPYRLLACELTRESIRDFQRTLGVISISPVALVPGSRDDLGDVVYIGRDPFASYQYLAFNPSNFVTEIPQAQARLHAPRLVRHSYGPAVSQDEGRRRTFESLAVFSRESDLSPLERQLGIRYVPAGEFLFLCLMWLWSGEVETTRRLSWRTIREVSIEGLDDQPGGLEHFVLKQLSDLGFSSDLGVIFGQLEYKNGNLIRESSRLSDLISMGLLTQSADGVLALTPRSEALSNWLAEAQALRRSDSHTAQNYLCLNRQRTAKLLPAPFTAPKRGESREYGARQMLRAIAAKSVADWLNGLRLVLKSFDQNRKEYRKFLRTEGFPIYPLVHLTLLFGLSEPLDWLAIPLGGIVSAGAPGAGLPDSIPQAGAFILALAREPEKVGELVNLLRPVLSVPALVESSSLVEDVISAKASVMDFGIVVLARQHEIKNLATELAEFRDPRCRKEKLTDAIKDPTSLQTLSDNLGITITAAQLLQHDWEFIDAMRANHWRSFAGELEDVQEEMILRAWRTLESLDEAKGRELKFLEGPSQSIWAPRAATFHLAIEALSNILHHDKSDEDGDRNILITFTPAEENRLQIGFWNSMVPIEPERIAQFYDLKSKPYKNLRIDGDVALLWLCRMAECDPHKDNLPHPLKKRTVGVLKLNFRVNPRS